MKRVFDCFLYTGESELLQIRLQYLCSSVDYFVICEQSYTFQNDPRSIDHELREQLIVEYGGKIRWILDYEQLNGVSPWERETRARNLLSQGLKDCNGDDIVMISDLDELPNLALLGQLDQIKLPAVCKQEFRIFDPHFKGSNPWMGTVITNFKSERDSIQDLRNIGTYWWKNPTLSIVENGGWHFTSMGGAKSLRRKIHSFSHTELRKPIFSSKFFLDILVKFGIAIQGNEVYRLNFELPSFVNSICLKNHNHDKLRFAFGILLRPLVQVVFKYEIGSLKPRD